MAELEPTIRIDYGPEALFIKASPSVQEQVVDYCGEPQNDIYCQLNSDETIFAIEPRKNVKWDQETLRRAILVNHPFYHLDEDGLERLAKGHETLFRASNDGYGGIDLSLNMDYPEEKIPVQEISQILVDNAIHDPKYMEEPSQVENFSAPQAAVPSQENPVGKETPSNMTEVAPNAAIACVVSIAVFAGILAAMRRVNTGQGARSPEAKPKMTPKPTVSTQAQVTQIEAVASTAKPVEKVKPAQSESPEVIALSPDESVRIMKLTKNISGQPLHHAIDQVLKRSK